VFLNADARSGLRWSPLRSRAGFRDASGATDEACAAVLDSLRSQTDSRTLAGEGIKGAKDQFLFALPAGTDHHVELFDVVAGLCGLRRETMTLSERHIKAYDVNADPEPHPHKDRLASQVAVGISVTVPEGSHIVLYPDDHREVNPFLSIGLRDSLEPDQLPEVLLRGCREVVVHDRPGDVLVFPGSSIWHLRRHSAGTVNLYLKFNDFDSDPLGEDPEAAARSAGTAAILASDAAAMLASVPRLSRRFDSIVRERSRVGWQERSSASVWGSAPVPLSDGEEALLKLLGGPASVAELAAGAGHGMAADAAVLALRRLASRGVVDLIAAVQ
jgi:hypothetical protein